MKISKSLALIILFIAISSSSLAQIELNGSNQMIGKTELLEDLEVLQRNLEMAQPGLYNYTPKSEMDIFFEELKNGIKDDMRSIDFFRLIAPLSDKIRNGHTILVPSSQWEDYVIREAKLLPLDLYYHSDQLYVLRNLSDKLGIVEGSVLKSINGKPATEVFNYMVDRWFKDGYNKTRPMEIVEEEFRFLYTHFFGATEKFEVVLSDLNGIELSLKLEGIEEPEFKRRLLNRYSHEYVPWWRRNPEPLSFRIDDQVAHLKVTLFHKGVQSNEGIRFNKFIKQAFKEIKQENVSDLILDLRGNAGGDVKPQLELLRHLVKTPFHLYKEVYANVRKLPNPEHYEFDMISRMEFKKNFENNKVNGVYSMKSQIGFEQTPQEPSVDIFKGNLYVLIDGWSFSATGEVCGILKEHRKDAIFMGEETGGNPVTNISGIQTFLTLPHSKNRILICLVNYTTDVSYKNDGFGVQPDYSIRNSVFDALEGKDSVMEKANQIIIASKKQ